MLFGASGVRYVEVVSTAYIIEKLVRAELQNEMEAQAIVLRP